MEYRCPYCGEPAFSARIKWGIVSKFGMAPRCPHCGRVSERKANHIGSFGYYLVLSLLALLFMACFVLAFISQQFILIFVGLLLFLVLYLLQNGMFSHFDKIYEKDRNEDPVFHFESKTTEKLWPAVRQGEIYVVQFPEEGRRPNDSPRIVGMIDKLEKSNDGWLFTVRAVSMAGDPKTEQGTDVRLVTDGMLVVPGTITENRTKK